MVVNFRVREISRGADKLAQTPILIIIKKIFMNFVICNKNKSPEIKPLEYLMEDNQQLKANS